MNVLVLAGAAGGFLAVALVGFLARSHELGRVHVLERLFLAAGAGLLASALGCQPVGIPRVDRIGTGLVIFAVALAASFASHVVLLVGAAALAVPALVAPGPSSVLGSLAASVPFGAGLGLVLLGRRIGLASASIAAAVAVGTCTVARTLPSNAPTLVGVPVAVVLAISGLVAMTSGRRAARAGLGVAVFAVLAAGGVVAGGGVAAALRAKPHAERAITLAEGALGSAESLRTAESAKSLDDAAIELRTANEALASPLARIARSFPVLGQNLRAVGRLTADAEALSVRGADFARTVDLSRLRPTGGRVDLAEFRRLGPDVRALRTPVRALLAEQVRSADDPWIAAPLRTRVNSLSERLRKLDRDLTSLDDALTVLPGVLGGDGPRRYLLIFPTTAEARGSGGLIGNFGELSAVNGELSLSKFGRNIDLQDNGTPRQARKLIASADYAARYTRFGVAYTWSNMNMSPDFPSSAQAMANHYPQSGGANVDGVISIDPIALASFLELLGPIDVPSWPEPLTSANAAEVLLHRSYVELGDKFKERLVVLADVANGVWAKLLTASLPEPARLADVFSPVARGRHLQLWSRVDAEQAYFARLGSDGAVPAVAGDSFGLVVNNAGGNKIDWFLRSTTSYDAEVNDNGSVSAVATVTLRNEAPSSGLPDYVIGSAATDEVIPKGSNRMYLSAYSVLPLSSWTANGAPLPFQSEQELGRQVNSAWITIPAGAEARMELRFAGPIGSPGTPYRVDVFRQPLVADAPVTVKVHRPRGTVEAHRAPGEPGTLTVVSPR